MKPMMAVGSGSPVGAMIVVSPIERKLMGRLTTCATAAKMTLITRMMPRAGQKRRRVRVHERDSAWRIVACSTMMAAGTSRSLIISHHVRGMAARMTRIVSRIAAGGAAIAMPMIPSTTTATTATIARTTSSE
ncbi:hypothetical protein RS82_01013 [Microbacterium trichothecenolyticum]|uniref:Uncharacterized protein n=1 Tax=Microbacterium trichothecenolyticum TaxID=69370 RepID=A0A0M2HIB6_MICTR|nr:hypothetical protein RS82_01013 [Microbacterium trichothecenolyticum]